MLIPNTDAQVSTPSQSFKQTVTNINISIKKINITRRTLAELVPTSRMGGVIPVFLLHAFVACTWPTLPFTILLQGRDRITCENGRIVYDALQLNECNYFFQFRNKSFVLHTKKNSKKNLYVSQWCVSVFDLATTALFPTS